MVSVLAFIGFKSWILQEKKLERSNCYLTTGQRHPPHWRAGSTTGGGAVWGSTVETGVAVGLLAHHEVGEYLTLNLSNCSQKIKIGTAILEIEKYRAFFENPRELKYQKNTSRQIHQKILERGD